MEFPESYFEDEVRGGYYIPSIMKKSWAADQELLSVIQEICERHQIAYYAEWGTLLGTIRHGGMIPWDDDIDICMRSTDFKKLLSFSDEFPEGYVILDYHEGQEHGNINMVAKIANWGSYRLSPHLREKYHGYPYVGMVDVFCLDYLPPKENEKKFREIMEYLQGVIGEVAKQRMGQEVDWRSVEECLTEIESFFQTEIDRKGSIEMQLYEILMDVLPSRNTEQAASEITYLPLWSVEDGYRLPKSCFEQSVKVPYENMEIHVPIGYEELLCKKYGTGYMNPVRAGGSHDYPYFEKIEKKLKERGEEIFEYKFSSAELQEAEQQREEERRNKAGSLRERAESFVPLFREVHENIIQLLASTDVSTAVETMGECQNVAAELGTMIEEEWGEGSKTVRVLEQYCEQLFAVSQELVSCVQDQRALDVEAVYAEFIQFEQKLESVIKGELQEKREIVFVPYKAEYWETMAVKWREAVADENSEVYVIPAPYYYKDNYGAAKLNEMQYDLDGYPEEVPLVSYSDYNFQTHHPDEIVIQCPYDDFNYAMTIHPFFHASNLKKYTEKLVYIPALVMDEVGPGDERMRKMLKYYCNMPGVVHADQVIVQSEQMRKVYIELLTEFAGEDTKEMWEKKICASEYPISEDGRERRKREREKLEIPEEWMSVLKTPEDEWKKIVLYTTSGSTLRMEGEKEVEKIQRVLQKFQEHKEQVALIWRPDSNVKIMLRKSSPRVWQAYRTVLQEYRDGAWGILDDTKDAKLASALCDGCYGDGGATMNRCRELGKPVMIQNVDC